MILERWTGDTWWNYLRGFFREILSRTIWENYLRELIERSTWEDYLMETWEVCYYAWQLLDCYLMSQCYWVFFREILSRTIWENYLRELLERSTWEDYLMETWEVCYYACMSKQVYLIVTWCRSSLFELKKMCFHSWVRKRLLKKCFCACVKFSITLSKDIVKFSITLRRCGLNDWS